MTKKNITKGKIGNAITSTAADHVVAVANDIFDEAKQQYQSEINQNNQGVIDFLGVVAITSDYFTDGAYITTGAAIGTIIDMYNTTANEDYRCAILECLHGQKFTINGEGGTGARLWAFVDTNGKLLTVASPNVAGKNIVIEAPTNARYVIFNDYGRTGTFYIGETKVNENNEKLQKMLRTVTNDTYLSALIDGEGHILCAFKTDGEVYIPKGMSEDAKKAVAALNVSLNDEVEARSKVIREIEHSDGQQYLYAIIDAESNVLLACYEDGTTYIPKGVPEDVKKIVKLLDARLNFLEDKVKISNRSDFILAFEDADGKLLGGWKLDGSLFIPKGMTEDARKALEDNVLCIEMDDETGDVYGLFGEDGNIEDVTMDEETGDIVATMRVEATTIIKE